MPRSLRLPVLVGAACVRQRLEDPREAREPIELMIARRSSAPPRTPDTARCSREADVDPRAARLLVLPRSGPPLAEGLGAARARSELAEIGVLQTTLFATAAARDRRGRARDRR